MYDKITRTKKKYLHSPILNPCIVMQFHCCVMCYIPQGILGHLPQSSHYGSAWTYVVLHSYILQIRGVSGWKHACIPHAFV